MPAEYRLIRNSFGTNTRKDFFCLKISIEDNKRMIKTAKDIAKSILPNLNPGQANSSENRTSDTVEIDNLSGIIAELTCYYVLKYLYSEEKIIKPSSMNSYNQIDLKLFNGKTIEVRSSCVRNGIDFALFKFNNKKPEEQYFDVLGPYSNGYKPGEIEKDYYMRVLYECDKKDFIEMIDKPKFEFYITGGATKDMMNNSDIYQIKHLIPDGGQVNIESDYRVIPLSKSLDIKEFFDTLESENKGLERKRDFNI